MDSAGPSSGAAIRTTASSESAVASHSRWPRAVCGTSVALSGILPTRSSGSFSIDPFFRLVGALGRKRLWLVFGLLVVAQWTAIGVFVAVVRHNGWLFYQGGDETFFWTSSWVLAHGHIPNSSIGYGWSMLLAPVARAVGSNYLEALPAIIVLQVVFLVPLTLFCVFAIARRIAGEWFGVVTAGLWIVVPFAVIPLW